MTQKIKETTPTLPEINHIRTRKAINLIHDKTGTHRALQQMNPGEYALFTDGSWTARRPSGKLDRDGRAIWDPEMAGWGCQICKKGKVAYGT
eukprot:COSAG02_NODE_30661_length_547_cov_1.022321_2_plen_91_part_01